MKGNVRQKLLVISHSFSNIDSHKRWIELAKSNKEFEIYLLGPKKWHDSQFRLKKVYELEEYGSANFHYINSDTYNTGCQCKKEFPINLPTL